MAKTAVNLPSIGQLPRASSFMCLCTTGTIVHCICRRLRKLFRMLVGLEGTGWDLIETISSAVHGNRKNRASQLFYYYRRWVHFAASQRFDIYTNGLLALQKLIHNSMGASRVRTRCRT